MINQNSGHNRLSGELLPPFNAPILAKVGRDGNGSFIDPTAFISGNVEMGEKDYIGPFVRIEANDPSWVKLSAEVNLQDNVTVSATSHTTVIGERTSIAHGAQVINATIGNFVFIGFNARIENAVIEDGAMVLHGARVMGVTIPKDRIVPPGSIITCEAQTHSLEVLQEANIEFKEEVISVNVELAAGYGLLGAVKFDGEQIKPESPDVLEPESVAPILGSDGDISKETRIIGCVRLGAGSSIDRMTSIRGDEGVPITIGPCARVGSRVTFHALKGQSIEIGEHLVSGDGVVFHGALTVGSQVTVGDNTVLFKSTVGSCSSIGKGAIIIGVRLAEDSSVPDGALVINQAEADQYSPQNNPSSYRGIELRYL